MHWCISFHMALTFHISKTLTLFKNRGAKRSFYEFFLCNFYKRRNRAPPPPPKKKKKKLMIFSLILLSYMCKTSQSYLVPVPNYWTWTKSNPQKNCFFWLNLYKIEVMITYFIETRELPNFGHMTASLI